MRRVHATTFLFIALCAGMATGCGTRDEASQPRAEAEDVVVARFDGGVIRRSEIAAVVERRLARRGESANPERRREVVRQVVAREARIALLHRQARELGMESHPDVAARIGARRDAELARAWLAHDPSLRVSVPDSVVEAELARRMAVASRPERRAFSHIFLRAANDAERTRARATATTIRSEVTAGASFADLARRHSDSITARAGGARELTARNVLPPDLGNLIFTLGQGQLSDVVETRDGLHLFRVDAIEPGGDPDEAGLRRTVVAELEREARTAAESALRQSAIDEAAIDVPAAAAHFDAGCPADDTLVDLPGGRLSCADFSVLRQRWPEYRSTDTAAALSRYVSHRMLARRYSDTPPSAPADPAETITARATHHELVAARRDDLMDAAVSAITDAEIEELRHSLGLSAPQLHEFVVDLLFLAQTGPDHAGVYAEGERIVARLRSGQTFDAVLQEAGSRPGNLARTAQHGIVLDQLTRDQPRVRDELLRLAAGEVSAPVYLSGNPLHAEGKPLLTPPGLLFLRKIEERVLPMPQARDALTPLLIERQRLAARDAIQRDLDRQLALEIVQADG